ncbi:hypothetical protein JW887_00325 [Candidatus Dojkabacteria bacterium]|nr:hypothetical protein [Candidatus Dojkabacteria bacterium]
MSVSKPKQKKINKQRISNNFGFTLIETLVYIALSAMITVTIVLFLLMILGGRQRATAISEVDSLGNQMMYQLEYSIKNSDGINSPLPGASEDSLSLIFDDPEQNPTYYYIDNSALVVSEAALDSVSLTSSRVVVSDVSFTNLTLSNSPTIIKIQFTITYKNPDNRKELDYSRTFYNSVLVNNY